MFRAPLELYHPTSPIEDLIGLPGFAAGLPVSLCRVNGDSHLTAWSSANAWHPRRAPPHARRLTSTFVHFCHLPRC